MKIKAQLLTASILVVLLTLSTAVQAANVNFAGAKVLLLEIRSSAWGAWLIITLSDSTGRKIMKLCDTAGGVDAISLPLTDPAAKAVLDIALSAKATGKTVTGWGLEPNVSGQTFCAIGNFAIFP